MSRFFVKESQIDLEKNIISILGEDVNHIKNVLRYNINDKLEICVKSENPKVYIAKIQEINSKEIICEILEEICNLKEAKISISIVQGIPKFDKMELIIQKCTELGVDRFIPLKLKYCVSKIEADNIKNKTARWQKIAEVAAKQCGRDKIPEVLEMKNLDEFCEIIKNYDCVLVAYEKEDKYNLKQVLKFNNNLKNIAIVIGPEGGFDEKEIERLKNNGAITISLGKRILRTETAPIVLSSIIMYELDGFSNGG